MWGDRRGPCEDDYKIDREGFSGVSISKDGPSGYSDG